MKHMIYVGHLIESLVGPKLELTYLHSDMYVLTNTMLPWLH